MSNGWNKMAGSERLSKQVNDYCCPKCGTSLANVVEIGVGAKLPNQLDENVMYFDEVKDALAAYQGILRRADWVKRVEGGMRGYMGEELKMTKQQEIREGVAKLTEDRFRKPAENAGLDWDDNFNRILAGDIINYLHSSGEQSEKPSRTRRWKRKLTGSIKTEPAK